MTIQSEIQALKCADCARSDSAVSDLQPDSLLPIPADALSGWRDGRPGSDGVTRRKLLRNGVLGFAAVYGATQLSFEEVWEAAVAQAAEPMQKSLVVIYLNGGNDGLNCFVPPTAPEYATYQTLRPTIARVLGDGTGAAVGTTVMPGTGGTLAFSNKLVSGAGADRNGDVIGFDTLYGDGTGGAGSDLAIIPAADYNPPNRSHFESRDYWFAGALSHSRPVARTLARRLRLALNPLQAVSLDSSLSKQIRSATAPVCALEGLQGIGFDVPGVTADVNSEVGKLAAVPFAPGNDALGRSRGMLGLTVDVANRLSTLTGGAPAPATRPTAASRRSCSSPPRCSRPVWARASSRSTGAASTRTATSSPGRTRSSPRSRARWPRSRPTWRRAASSRTSSRWSSRSSAAASRSPTRPAPTTAPAARSCSAARPSRAASPASTPGVNVNQDGDLVVKTDFRTVYQSLIQKFIN